MKELFTKKQILTIPNMLSIFRILLIPPIVWYYCVAKKQYVAVALIVLSGVTDIVDGFIARHFNMISDFGKIIDPVADKLTQGVVILCLATVYKLVITLVVVFAVCEITKFIFGAISVKKYDSVNGAKWYGKVNTVLVYLSMVLLILFPDIPSVYAGLITGVCIGFVAFSTLMYVLFYVNHFAKIKSGKAGQ